MKSLGVQKHTDDVGIHMPQRQNVAAYGRANWKHSHTYFLLGTGKTQQVITVSKQTNSLLLKQENLTSLLETNNNLRIVYNLGYSHYLRIYLV